MKTLLITGAAQRIGAAIARRFAEQGYRVIIHCNSSTKQAEALLSEFTSAEHRVISADFENPNEVDNLFAKLDTPIDLLINNASTYSRYEGVLAEDSSTIKRFFQVNAFAPISLMQQFAKQRLESGVIINLLDMEIFKSSPSGGAYSWSRRALVDATLEFARELAPQIRVCGVAPGPVLPPAWAPESRMNKVLQSVPLQRAVAVDDLVDTVVFLAHNNSITGEIIAVDGGQHLT